MPKYKNFEDLSKRQQHRRIKVMMDMWKMNEAAKNQATAYKTNNENILPSNTPVFSDAINIVKVEPSFQHSDAENLMTSKSSLLSKLEMWAVEHQETEHSFNSLLQILKDEGHSDLPSDVSVIKNSEDAENEMYKSQEDELQNSEILGNQSSIDTSFIHDLDGHTCCEACRAEFYTINRKLDHIIHTLNNKSPIQRVLNIHPRNIGLLPDLPLTTIDGLRKFDADLQSSTEMRDQLTYRIVKIGGDNERKHVRNVLAACFTDDLAYKLSWTGQKNTEGIKDTAVANLIVDTILNVHPSSNIAQIQSRIQDWLRHAGDRWRYHNKKLAANGDPLSKFDEPSC